MHVHLGRLARLFFLVVIFPSAVVFADAAPRTLTVQVYDSGTHSPIAGATIRFWPASDQKPTATGADGKATILLPLDIPVDGRSDDQASLVVSHPDYASETVDWNLPGGNVLGALPATCSVSLSRGNPVHAFVRDEKGMPVADAVITCFGENRPASHGGRTAVLVESQFSSVATTAGKELVTDAEGGWTIAHFPSDLNTVYLTVKRAGGASASFVARDATYALSEGESLLDLDALKRGDAVLVLKSGFDYHGIVIDSNGHPVEGAQVRARDTSRFGPYSETKSGVDGRFELPHWSAPEVMITVEKPGYQDATSTVTPKSLEAASRFQLKQAKPFALQVVDERGSPVPGAQIQTDPNNFTHLLNWKTESDKDGRAVWVEAPPEGFRLWINAPGNAGAVVRVPPGRADTIVTLAPKDRSSIAVRIRAIDDVTGASVRAFEVWASNGGYEEHLWGTSDANGRFSGTLHAKDLPAQMSPEYRFEVRAAGYEIWQATPRDFGEGDQNITVRLTHGAPVVVQEPSIDRIPRKLASAKEDPALASIASAVASLLNSGDVDTFVVATVSTNEEWADALPPGTPDGASLLGDHPKSTIDRYRTAVRSSAQHLISQAKDLGVTNGHLKFSVISVAAPSNGRSTYTVGRQHVSLPGVPEIRIVLSAAPDAATNGTPSPLAGTYELALGGATRLPAGWREEQGIRWISVPEGVGSASFRSTIALVGLATQARIWDVPVLSGASDVALESMGSDIAAFLKNQSVEGLVASSVMSKAQVAEYFSGRGLDEPQLAGIYNNQVADISSAAQGVVDLDKHVGLDLSHAVIRVKSIAAVNLRPGVFGTLDGLSSFTGSLTLGISGARSAKDGRSLDGTYVLSLGRLLRHNDRWTLQGYGFRWTSFPDGFLDSDAQRQLTFENYIADHHALPPQTAAPEISVVRLADNQAMTLSSLRGKVVVLEFWASWCLPCQESMADLQSVAGAHPEWKDRVRFLAVSIDNTAQIAADHIAKKQWTKTQNAWAGTGAFFSKPAGAYRIGAVPTLYVVDPSGTIAISGHPMSIDVVETVSALLATNAAHPGVVPKPSS